MLGENNDVLWAKKLLNQTESYMDDGISRESRNCLIDELLKVLSNTSWELKNEIIKLKKSFVEVLDNENGKEKGEMVADKMSEIMQKDPYSDNLMMSLNVFSAMKEFWLWNEENAKSYVSWLSFQSDGDLQSISERFSKYENAFVWYYEKLAIEYMRRNKKIPDYKTILRICFCDYIERYMKSYVKNMKFTEERFKEWFWVIQERLKEKWLDLEASDNIKKSFIDLCREKYSLAKKSCNFLFDSKSFKRDFLSDTDKSLGHDLGDYFDDIIKWCKQNMVDDEELNRLEGAEKNWALLTNIIVNVVVNVNGLIDEWTWDDDVIWWYFIYIADEFEKDHNKKLRKTKEEKKVSINKTMWESIVPEQPKTTWKDVLSEEENNLIKEAVSYIDGESKDSIVKYITKLKIKDLPLNFYDLKRLFNIEEIPPQTESILIDQIWMDYEIEEEILKAKEEQEEKTELQENQTVVPEKIEVEDPTGYLIDKLKSVWCVFDNELTARKQIDEFCLNDNYKTVLINLMTNPRFGKVFVYKSGHKTARLLRIGRTGWRILFAKRKDGNLHFVCFANHNNYEDRLEKLK